MEPSSPDPRAAVPRQSVEARADDEEPGAGSDGPAPSKQSLRLPLCPLLRFWLGGRVAGKRGKSRLLLNLYGKGASAASRACSK